MKKIGYWFIAYGLVLLGISFLWDILYMGEEKMVQTSAKAMEIELPLIVSETAIDISLEPVKTQKPPKKEVKEKRKKATVEERVQKNRDEKKILERIVEAEAGGQDLKGRILVANVILNRMKKEKYPNTVKGVVFASADGVYQFSPVKDGRFFSVKISEKTKRAVQKALEGTDYSKGALYFMNRKTANPKNIRWFDSKLTRLFKHGGHEFFR